MILYTSHNINQGSDLTGYHIAQIVDLSMVITEHGVPHIGIDEFGTQGKGV